MPLDADFLSAVAPLYVPTMGTELMGPLLYSLVRSTRPQSVLEVGMGYTTPFILQGLADNTADHHAERQLIGKALATAGPEGPDAIDGLPLALPDHYREVHTPRLHAIDDLSHPHTSAQQVAELAADRGLAEHLVGHNGDFRGYSRKFDRADLPFDIVWLDAGDYLNFRAFCSEYWDLVNPDGGLLLIHSTLTNIEGLCFLKSLKLEQATTGFNDFELLSLLEPHKTGQNSVTLIRMTKGYAERVYSMSP